MRCRQLCLTLAGVIGAGLALGGAAGRGAAFPTERTAGVRQEAPSAGETADLDALMDQGQEIFGRDCSECHNPEGTGQGPTFEANAHLAERDVVIQRILAGSPKGTMAPFAGSLSNREVAAVATFIRNSMANSYGLVRESEVAAVRSALKR